MVFYLKNFFTDAGKVTQFTAKFFKEIVKSPFEIKEFTRQCFNMGYKSLPLVALTGFIMGLVTCGRAADLDRALRPGRHFSLLAAHGNAA